MTDKDKPRSLTDDELTSVHGGPVFSSGQTITVSNSFEYQEQPYTSLYGPEKAGTSEIGHASDNGFAVNSYLSQKRGGV